MGKKILHITSSVDWRGGEQQVNHLFNYTPGVFEKYLFCPENAEILNRNPTKIKKIFTYKRHWGINLFAALKLKKICENINADLLHLHDSHAINTYLIARIFGMNVPAIIHRHVNFPVRNKLKYNHAGILKIICVSEEVKETLKKVADEKKLVVIHPGIDIKKFTGPVTLNKNYLHRELNIDHEKKIIGMVTSLEKEKNIAEFVAIAGEILGKRTDTVFVVIGSGPEKYKFEHLTLNNNHIGLLGFRNDIPEILSSLSVFLFTSKNEGFPLVLLEAMAAKIPVVTTNSGGIKNMVSDQQNGLLYELGNIKEGVKKTEELLSEDRRLRSALTENALEYVKQFDVTLMNLKMEQIYSSII